MLTFVWQIAGSCIPAWTLVAICCYLTMFIIDLVNHSVANSEINTIRDLYMEAKTEVRLAIPQSRTPEVRALLTDHDRILSSFLSSDRYRARILGFAVDVGVARTVLVTLFTVAVGLWSVLRSSGIYLTPELACSLGR
jgi:hypothetical protein